MSATLKHSFKFARFIPVHFIVPNGKYPHNQVVICQTLLDWKGMFSVLKPFPNCSEIVYLSFSSTTHYVQFLKHLHY